MLREVSLFMSKHDNTVSVVALESEDLLELKAEAALSGGRINPIQVDYKDATRFASAIRNAMKMHGPIMLAIAWMSTDALPDAANVLVQEIMKLSPVCRYFQVLPSSGITGKDRRFLENPFPEHNRILYRKIILGFHYENGMLKWLTNSEVAAGVIEAVRDDEKDAVVGEVEPPQAPAQMA